MLTVILPILSGAQLVRLSLLGYHTTVPLHWEARGPSSAMRLAEFTVPADGDARAEVVVYFFGKAQGGTVASNLARWKAQFSMPDGSPVYERTQADSAAAGFPVTFAEYRGTYARGIGAGNAATAKAGQALLAGIAETPRGTLFIQLFGDSSVVATQRAPFHAFVKGLRE